ncbi:MAG: TatD family hydrolase [Fimbriimonadales bacterium]
MTDTHCHLNLTEHFPDPTPAVDRGLAAGVQRLIVVGLDDETSRIAVDLAVQFESVFACVGWHPTSAAKFESTDEIERLCGHPKVVAIGEIGLDYHWDYSTPEQQRVSLEAQWGLACQLGLPVVFHCREAYDDLLDWLEAQESFPPSCVFHCFAGDASHAKRGLALPTDVFFGVDGPVTYKNAAGLREIVGGLPRESLLLETDSPFLTPHPHRGKPNEPAMIPLICEGVASVLGITAEKCSELTDASARRAFPRLV